MWQLAPLAVGGVDRVDVAVEDARAVDRPPRGSAESGGASSVVTAKLPGAQHALEPAGRGVARAGSAADSPGPVRRSKIMARRRLRRAVSRTTRSQDERPCRRRSTGGCTVADRRRAAGHALRCRRQASTQTQLISGLHLAMAVGAHAAAGTVAQLLRAVHRAGHAGRAQHALAAHLAVEQQALDRALRRRPPAARAARSRSRRNSGSQRDQQRARRRGRRR